MLGSSFLYRFSWINAMVRMRFCDSLSTSNMLMPSACAWRLMRLATICRLFLRRWCVSFRSNSFCLSFSCNSWYVYFEDSITRPDQIWKSFPFSVRTCHWNKISFPSWLYRGNSPEKKRSSSIDWKALAADNKNRGGRKSRSRFRHSCSTGSWIIRDAMRLASIIRYSWSTTKSVSGTESK